MTGNLRTMNIFKPAFGGVLRNMEQNKLVNSLYLMIFPLLEAQLSPQLRPIYFLNSLIDFPPL